MISSFASRQFLEALTRYLEVATYTFTLIGALAGVGYLLANRPLKRMLAEDAENQKHQYEADSKQKDLNIELARAEAATAKTTAEGFRLEIAQALVEQERLKKNNIELETQLEKDRAARIELEKEVAFRKISKEQADTLVLLLAAAHKSNPTSVITIRAPNSSNESAQFAERLRDILNLAGWSINRVFYNIIGGMPVEKGVIMGVSDQTNPTAITIQTEFKKLGIQFKGVVDASLPNNQIVIVVGQKE